jgi:hypothetical protein
MAYTTIDDPTLYFQAKTYTGTGSSNSVTLDGDTNMQPDWVWIKNRSTGYSHQLYDVLRGVTKRIFSDLTTAEETDTNALTAFNSDGFTVGSNVGVNENTSNHVAWNWKGGGSGSSNSNGSITSSVSASTAAGFSVVSWTGSGSAATIGHGLGATPKCIIVKNKTDTVNWFVYNPSVITAGATNKSFMTLNVSDALGTNGSATTFTSVSSTTFGVGTDNIINGSSDSMIAYVIAEKQGYSKVGGSYVGNGNNNNAYIHTGFKPAFIILKNTTNAQNWYMYDNKRTPTNLANLHFYADLSNAEAGGSTLGIDILSNGFKIRTSNDGWGESGSTYIYIAFAESPFVNSSGVPNNAR